eukprot:3823149-Amphidinium_carterae.1
MQLCQASCQFANKDSRPVHVACGWQMSVHWLESWECKFASEAILSSPAFPTAVQPKSTIM